MRIAEGHHPITVGSTCLSRSDLMAAAGAVSAALGGISRVAVLATPTMETVLAVVGALRAGVEVVPVPSDAGSAELAHILADAQPQRSEERRVGNRCVRACNSRCAPY